MKIKVCGMKFRENIAEIAALKPDFLGFIFYPKSPRYAANHLVSDQLRSFDKNITKVGVFVNENLQEIKRICSEYHIGTIQLHGTESPEFCDELEQSGFQVIKAFGLNEDFNFNNLKLYEKVCEYFLFDTQSKNFGGSGKKFNWEILERYQMNKAFFLSGGIRLEDLDSIRSFRHEQLYAIDVNSGFELKAGLKNAEQITLMINQIRNGI